ncbi:unnamed protein product, partial [Mesorhabditis belari]|uniref:Glutamate decarboxylase n=1 Tax=Mesorhabditis belari TaxID=2138241 RepID=A0AAF3FHE4_9BILA
MINDWHHLLCCVAVLLTVNAGAVRAADMPHLTVIVTREPYKIQDTFFYELLSQISRIIEVQIRYEAAGCLQNHSMHAKMGYLFLTSDLEATRAPKCSTLSIATLYETTEDPDTIITVNNNGTARVPMTDSTNEADDDTMILKPEITTTAAFNNTSKKKGSVETLRGKRTLTGQLTNRRVKRADAKQSNLWVASQNGLYIGKGGEIVHLSEHDVKARLSNEIKAFKEQWTLIGKIPEKIEEKGGFTGLTRVQGFPIWQIILLFLAIVFIIIIAAIMCHKFRDTKKKLKESERKLKAESRNRVENARWEITKKSHNVEEPPRKSKNKVNGSIEPRRRASAERIEEPVTAQEFVAIMHRVSDFIATHFSSPSFYDATSQNPPGTLLKILPGQAPEQPEDFDQIEADITGLILRGISHRQHPRFHGHPSNGHSFTSIISDTIAAGIGLTEQPDVSGRKQLEMCVVNWYGRALGLPEAFLYQGAIKESPGGGTIMDNFTVALLHAIVAARHWKLGQLQTALSAMNSATSAREFSSRLVCYGNRTHTNFESVCTTVNILHRILRPGIDKEYAMGGAELKEQIKKDLAEGLVPTFVVCTYGSGDVYSWDDLKAIAVVARRYNLWLHVDAASCGVAWIDPSYQPKGVGIEDAMSVCVNAPRCFLNNSSPCIYWTRDQRQHCLPFRSADNSALLTWTINKDTTFKGLKLWIDMRLFGVHGLRNYVNNLIDLTAHMEEMVTSRIPQLRKFSAPIRRAASTEKPLQRKYVKIACLVQYYEPSLSKGEVNRMTKALAMYIIASRRLYVAHRTFDQHHFIYLSVAHEKANLEEVKTSVEILETLVKEFVAKKNEIASSILDAEESVELLVVESKRDSQTIQLPITKERLPLEVLQQIGMDSGALKKIYHGDDTSTCRESVPQPLRVSFSLPSPSSRSQLTPKVQGSIPIAMPPLQPKTSSQPLVVSTPSKAKDGQQQSLVQYRGVVIADSSSATPTPSTPTATTEGNPTHAGKSKDSNVSSALGGAVPGNDTSPNPKNDTK